MAGEQPIDGCTDQELELFLKKSRSLIVHLLPEPDDYNQTTNAGIVGSYTLLSYLGAWSVAQMLWLPLLYQCSSHYVTIM